MNLIELENLVKGAPDEDLTNEVKQPTGKIPPFLALSEIQRRKDMRDRYTAQKNEGAKPTIAEQLTGGIGSIGGAEAPQGAPVPTPSATGIPSAGAPPVAAGAAPMPTPPGQPQGFAAGGIVGYAQGGGTGYMDLNNPNGYWEKYFPTARGALREFTLEGRGENMASNEATLERLKRERIASSLSGDIKDAFLSGTHQGYAQDPSFYEKEKSRNSRVNAKNQFAQNYPNGEYLLKPEYLQAKQLAEANSLPTGSAPDNYLRRSDAPVASDSVPASARPGPLPASAPSGGMGGYTSTAGGIGSIDPNQALAGSAPSGGQTSKTGIPNPYNLSEPELAYEQYMMNDKNFVLPEALSYQGFIDEAVGEEQAIREEAKRQAIGAALVQLGAGLAVGDMAKGFTTAGAESRDILSEGRREASAQKALAQQFKLRGMEGEREQQMKTMEIEQQRVMSLAQFAGGNRKDAEARAMQIMEMKQRAADRAANLSISLAGQEMTRDRYALEAKKDRVQLRSELLRATIGEPPSAKAMADYQEQVALRLGPDGKPKPGFTVPPNPMDVYRKYAAQVAPEIERQVAEVFEGKGYTPVAPVSNPPKDYTGYSLVGTEKPKN